MKEEITFEKLDGMLAMDLQATVVEAIDLDYGCSTGVKKDTVEVSIDDDQSGIYGDITVEIRYRSYMDNVDGVANDYPVFELEGIEIVEDNLKVYEEEAVC